MKFPFRIKQLVLFIIVVSVISSCKKDAKTNWDTELLVPIATTNLTLRNLVKDTSILKTNPDNSMKLVFNSQLYNFNLAEQIVKIPDTSIGQKFNLTELRLPNQYVDFKASLGMIAQNALLTPNTQALGQFLITFNGSSLPIPAVSGLAMPPFHYAAPDLFDSAYLSSGEVEIVAENHLPIPISTARISLFNTGDQTLVGTYNCPPIAANSLIVFSIPIAGSRITNQLDFVIDNLSSPGSNGASVLIDTSNYIELKATVRTLRASEAWAKFPAQNVVDLTEDLEQVIGDRKFTYVDARSGFLHIDITSSVQQKLYLDYTLVGAFDNHGIPLHEYTEVPPAPVGGTISIDTMINIAGFAINLSGKDGSKFNAYTQRIIAHIDSDGLIHHITTADSINIRYTITEIAPNYIKGYAGRDTITGKDSADFAFLDIFKSGSIGLEDVKMTFTVDNGIGVDGQVKINGLTAMSQNNGSRALSGSIVGQPFVINRATDFPLTPAHSEFLINSTNSNIKDLLGILPNKLKYDVEVRTNVNGNNGQYRDFAYLESGLKIGLNAEVPLSIVANHLVLVDTFDFNIAGTNTNINGITDGVLNLITENVYPIDADITILLYDENWQVVDTLTSNAHIAGGVPDANCKVQAPTKSKVPLYVSEDRMTKVKLARHAVATADFNSTSSQLCNGLPTKIYSTYTLGITFTARFNYKVNAKF